MWPGPGVVYRSSSASSSASAASSASSDGRSAGSGARQASSAAAARAGAAAPGPAAPGVQLQVARLAPAQPATAAVDVAAVAEGPVPGRGLVQHQPDAPRVGRGTDVSAPGLLGGHGPGRADPRAARPGWAGESQVDQPRDTAADHHVARLDVQVQVPAAVQVAGCGAQVSPEETEVASGSRRCSLEHDLQRRPRHQPRGRAPGHRRAARAARSARTRCGWLDARSRRPSRTRVRRTEHVVRPVRARCLDEAAAVPGGAPRVVGVEVVAPAQVVEPRCSPARPPVPGASGAAGSTVATRGAGTLVCGTAEISATAVTRGSSRRDAGAGDVGARPEPVARSSGPWCIRYSCA